MAKMDLSLIRGIVAEFGSPLYVYDADSVRIQYVKLENTFKKINHRIHYAMKANENEALLYVLKDLGSGIDAVSPYEIDRALNIGFKPNDIVFTPSCTSVNEIVYGLELGVNVNIGAIEYFSMLGEKLKGKKIGLRLNPAIKIDGNQKIATGHSDSKFGIPIKYLNKVLEYKEKYGFDVIGLHIHTGSNVNNVKDLNKSVDSLFEHMALFDNIEYIDIGSGLKIKYRDEDLEIDIDQYAKYIEEKVYKSGRDIEIKIEPGKYLVGNAGYLLTSVNIVKQGYEKMFVGVNSGFSHLIRPMYYDAYHEIVNISNPTGNKKKYDVVGQLCEEDTFAKDRELNEVRVGDIILIKSSGAYGFSMAMDYNLRKKPKEVMVDNGNAFLV